MSAYVYDPETVETIFTEVAKGLKDRATAHPLFMGTRDSQVDFWLLFKTDLADIKATLRAREYGYGEYVSAIETLVEWLVWLRQNHWNDLPQNLRDDRP
jgi:hypothetical protein